MIGQRQNSLNEKVLFSHFLKSEIIYNRQRRVQEVDFNLVLQGNFELFLFKIDLAWCQDRCGQYHVSIWSLCESHRNQWIKYLKSEQMPQGTF